MVESLKADFNDHIGIDNSKAASYLNQDNFRLDEDSRIFPTCRLKSLKIYLFTVVFTT
jgi:hypothetical protein